MCIVVKHSKCVGFIVVDAVFLQRLHRIITSEELVSAHTSAREMIEVVKNRDFTKLFQKSVKKVNCSTIKMIYQRILLYMYIVDGLLTFFFFVNSKKRTFESGKTCST